ncbi:MAG: ABC transporter permease [Actinomycetota bacterium]|nr:ABC transporter permease [Actinomycetota bacterium]
MPTELTGGDEAGAGAGPWQLAGRRLRRNKTALAFGALFIVLVGVCLAAPLYAEHIAGRDAFAQPASDERVTVDGEDVLVVELNGVPIGPTYGKEYFLGADSSGRDVAVRLLYGGRNSLLIGVAAALITITLGVFIGILAGYFRGWVDTAISRVLDIIWSFPVILLGIALGTALAVDGLKIGPLTIAGKSLAIPVLIIALVYIPYLARPIRGQVLSLREKEFVESARAQGMGSFRIMFGEILPNVMTTLIVFFPLLIANAILLEAALSFLGAGVRAPNPSWGTMIQDGVSRIVTAPMLAVVPGGMLVLTVLALNVFGDGVRDALDPRAKIRLEH